MSFFSSENNSNSAALSLFGKGSNFEGKMDSAGTIDIAGNYNGEIKAKEVVLREGSRTNATIVAEIVRINGYFDGHVQSDHLIIEKHGAIHGKMSYKTIIVESGGMLHGEINRVE